MQLDEQLHQHIDLLPMDLKAEVFDFVLFLEQKQLKKREENKKAFLNLIHNIEPVKAPFSSEEMVAMLRQGQEQLIIDARESYAK